MNYLKYLSPFMLSFFVLFGCQSRSNIIIEVKNSIDHNISDQIVTIELSELPNVNIDKLAAFDGDLEVPSQLVDINVDREPDNFAFIVNLGSNQTKVISILETKNKKNFKQRAHAEISEKIEYKLVDGVYKGGKFISVKRTKTPEGHKDHNLYYKCEGPCWESDRVGYRFYLDQRNATDIFGKKVSEIVLPNVGHTYSETGNEMYHTMADWGLDILKVGHSLGIGSFASFVDGKVEMVAITDSIICTIKNDGPIIASVNTKYFGWKFNNQKTNLEANLSIVAGSRLTECNYSVTTDDATYCTGLVKYEGTEFIKSEHRDGWNYIALWGNHTAVNDNLGMAIFYSKESKPNLTEDELNYIVTFAPNNGNIQYYFAACWEQELDGIKTKDEFIEYMDEEIEKLNNPVELKIVK